MSKAQRLNEYGMYIHKNRQGTYNLGISYAPRGGIVLATFPTYDDAYEAFESFIESFWEWNADDLYRYAHSFFAHQERPAQRRTTK